MKTLFATIMTCLFAITLQAQDTIKPSDFRMLNNTRWEGTLSYKDYQSGKQSTIEATLQINIEGDKIKTSIQYVYEPNKNNKSSVKIKKNGSYYGNEKVVSNRLENNTRTIVTRYNGRDNGKKATFFVTHSFNDKVYTISKEVMYSDTTNRFVRNTYSFSKL